MLRKYIALAAALVMMALLAAPLALAQQNANSSVEVAPQVPQPVQSLPDPNSPDNAGFLQYSSGVPPGYQLQPGGNVVCPSFDPHGPACFRIY